MGVVEGGGGPQEIVEMEMSKKVEEQDDEGGSTGRLTPGPRKWLKQRGAQILVRWEGGRLFTGTVALLSTTTFLHSNPYLQTTRIHDTHAGLLVRLSKAASLLPAAKMRNCQDQKCSAFHVLCMPPRVCAHKHPQTSRASTDSLLVLSCSRWLRHPPTGRIEQSRY